MEPLVSVGLPVYNAGRGIIRAVVSVLMQSYQHWELVIVDDGSTDGALELVSRIRDARVRVYHFRSNRGLAAALNEVACRAKGKYLARMDADDAMHPLRLTKQVEYLALHQECDLVGTGMYVVHPVMGPISKRVPPCLRTGQAFRHVPLLHATVLGKLSWFQQHPYDPSVRRAEDRELWARCSDSLSFGNLSEPLYFYTEHSSFSLRKYAWSCLDNARVILRYAPRYSKAQTAWLLCCECGKVICYCIASVVGCEQMLVQRRSTPLSESERVVACAVFERIEERSASHGLLRMACSGA